MELEELRRHWRQPEPAAPPALTSGQLEALHKGRTLGLAEKMRRNAWLEAGASALIGLVLLAALPFVHDGLYRLFAIVTEAMAVVLVVYYYRVLGQLRRMAEPGGSVRGHLATLAQGLRQQLRFYYWLSLVTLPLMFALTYGYLVALEWQRPAPARIWPLLGIGVAMLLLGGFAQLCIAHATRQWIQRLYGQHLDRLEGQLRELSEDELPTV